MIDFVLFVIAILLMVGFTLLILPKRKRDKIPPHIRKLLEEGRGNEVRTNSKT